jgi:hypothetical protein
MTKPAHSRPYRGVFPVVPTIFDEGGGLDLDGQRRALDFMIDAAPAEAEGHHPDIRFGWGYATVSLQTKKIKGPHKNDFIMAAKIDRIAAPRPNRSA